MDASLFVSRDRARRFAYSLAQAAQERRLAYRGAEIGMASLTNSGLVLLEAVVKDAETSVTEVLEGRLRDRERGYLDIPFTVMTEGVLERLRLALRLERARAARRIPEPPAQQALLELVGDAQRRIDAFCAVYDEKRPLPAPRATDLGRMLARVERDAAWERDLASRAAGAPLDAVPPELTTAADALEDLLRAARAALPLAPAPWHLTRGRAGEPLRLALGTDASTLSDLPPPPRLERALRVLAFLHPVGLRVRGPAVLPAAVAKKDWGAPPDAPPTSTEPLPVFLEIALPDPAAGGTELSAAAGAGGDARLSPEAEKAVRALMAAPPLPHEGPPPAQRAIALLGLLKAFDGELLRTLLPRLGDSALRAAARELPREPSRKAPLKRDLVQALESVFPGLPASQLEDLVEDIAQGKAGRRRCTAADAALLLALFARPFTVGGYKATPSLRVAPWAVADVEATIAELLEVASVRKVLDGGRGIDAATLTRFERSAVALLGRLGRLALAR